MRTKLIGNGLLTARISEQLAAILAALQLQGSSVEALTSLEDSGWQEVLSLCDRMQLTLPLALRSFRDFPSWVNERLMGNLRDTARRFARVRLTYCELAAALDSAGIPHVVLKGFAQSPNFVKAPQYRAQSDIDLYTDGQHIQSSVQALKAIGYESSGPAEVYRFADHVPTLTRNRGWKPSRNPYDPTIPLALDVHHCLWNTSVSMIWLPEVEDFWKRRVNRKLGEFSFPSLCLVDHLGYFALHMLRDLFTGDRVLHHALELATFLHERTEDAAFWMEWQSTHSPRLREMQAIPLALAGAAFCSQLPDAVQEQINGLPSGLRVWIEMCGGDLLAQTYCRTRDGRLLQFLLANSPRARRKLLWKVISPGAVSSPGEVASWPEDAAEPRLRHRRGLWRYPAYLASRISLNGAAVCRVVMNGLTVLISSLVHRQTDAC